MTKYDVCLIGSDAGCGEQGIKLIQEQGFRVKGFASLTVFLRTFDEGDARCVIVAPASDAELNNEYFTRLQKVATRTPYLVCSDRATVAQAVDAFKWGAFDFIDLPCDPGRLLEAVQSAIAKSAEVRLQEEKRLALRKKLAHLESRERDFIAVLLEYDQNGRIADALGLSDGTRAAVAEIRFDGVGATVA